MKRIDEKTVWTMPKAVKKTVRLPAVQVDGLPPDELKSALAFELESETGIPASEAFVAWRVADEADPAMRAFEVAVIRRGKPGAVGGGWLLAVGTLLVIGAVGGIGYDYSQLAARTKELSVEVAKQRELQAELDRITAGINANRSGIESLKAAREAMARVQQTAAEHRAAWAELLAALTEACGDDAILKHIAADGSFAATIEAVSLSPQEAVKTMVALTKALEPKGWKLAAGPVKTRQPGTTVLFSMHVEFEGGAK